MGLSAGLNACDNDEAINLGHSPPRSNSTHTEQKKRSFMVNDILTDRISSSNSSPECSVDLTSKSLEMDPYLQFDMTASSPGSQTAIHGEPLDARISNNPTNFDFSSAVNVSRISEHQSKRPRMTKSPNHLIGCNMISNETSSFDPTGNVPAQSPQSSSHSSTDDETDKGTHVTCTRSITVITKPFGSRYTSTVKQGKKLRKARTAFTDQQLNELEHSFDRQKYLAVQDRMELAARLGLSDMQVKTWYQNRRTKWKRQTAVGLELLAEADNFVAVQRLLQQSTYWAYHPAAQCILNGGDRLTRPHGYNIGDGLAQTDKHKPDNDGIMPIFTKMPQQSGSSSSLGSKGECETRPMSPLLHGNTIAVQLPSTDDNPASILATNNSTISFPMDTAIPNCRTTHPVNPIDLFWLSNWLSQIKGAHSRHTGLSPTTQSPQAPISTMSTVTTLTTSTSETATAATRETLVTPRPLTTSVTPPTESGRIHCLVHD